MFSNLYIPRLVAHNTCMQSFQYRILNDVFFADKKTHIFHIFGTKSSPLCSPFSVIYVTKHLFLYFMNVTMLKFNDQSNIFTILSYYQLKYHRPPILEFLIM